MTTKLFKLYVLHQVSSCDKLCAHPVFSAYGTQNSCRLSLTPAGFGGEEETSVSGRSSSNEASRLSWSCSASLGADSKLTVHSAKGHPLLSCSFAVGKFVSHTSDYFEAVPGRARPPPERWRAALEVQSASVRLHTSGDGNSDSVSWQLCTAQLFSTGLGSSLAAPAAGGKATLQCECSCQHTTDDFIFFTLTALP